nr:unnamed protein product [Callosobruchus chinensis]
MDQEPSSSKRVKYGDADYEDTLLKWFEEVVSSDDSDIGSVCEENFAIESEHSSESEFEGDADTVEDETVIETEVSDSESSSESV